MEDPVAKPADVGKDLAPRVQAIARLRCDF